MITPSRYEGDESEPRAPGKVATGPGEYEYDDGMGNQVDSRRPTNPRPTMKGVGRDKAPIGAKMAHEEGPGPQQYKVQSGLATFENRAQLSAYTYGRAAPSARMSSRTKFGDPFAKWG